MWWISLLPWRTILVGVVALVISVVFGWGRLKSSEVEKLEAAIAAMQRAAEIAPIIQEQGRRDEQLTNLGRQLNIVVENRSNSNELVSHPRIREFFDRLYDNTTD